MKRRQVLTAVWRQTSVENADIVKLGAASYGSSFIRPFLDDKAACLRGGMMKFFMTRATKSYKVSLEIIT
jgi:hypothetical protein